MSTSEPAPGRVKHTRRRERLSCSECTKRRQKCDRQTPCSNCTHRRVAHLCVREPFYVRPPPARALAAGAANSHASPSSTAATCASPLPNVASALSPITPDTPSTIDELNDRIYRLEALLARQNGITPVGQSAYNSSGGSTPRGDLSSPILRPFRSDQDSAHIGEDVREAATTLAQLALAHDGEYLGTGSVVSAIHKLGSQTSQLRFCRSTVSTSQRQVLDPYGQAAIRKIASVLPEKDQTLAFFDLFFQCRNWSFGVPEPWFRMAFERMWNTLCAPHGDQDINAHYLQLVFAILSCAPRNLNPDNVAHFTAAIAARRIGEDGLLARSLEGGDGAADGSTISSYGFGTDARNAACDGAVLSCVAAPILGCHLADRGRVSEAWKLVGGALRSAQAAGMHRDPNWRRWRAMDSDECALRIGGWWSLVCADRLYSHVLGRPAMIRKGTYDVQLPPPTSPDGAPWAYGAFAASMVLLTDIIADAGHECLNIKAPSHATVLEVDRRFQEWERQLSTNYHWRAPAPAPSGNAAADCNLSYQRGLLSHWYLASRMSLHQPYLSASGSSNIDAKVLASSRATALDLSRELVRSMLTSYVSAASRGKLPFGYMTFANTYLLFAGATVLASHSDNEDDAPLVAQAEQIMTQTVADGFGEPEIARRAVTVLSMLRETHSRPTRPKQGPKGDVIQSLAPEQYLLQQSTGTVEYLPSELLPPGFSPQSSSQSSPQPPSAAFGYRGYTPGPSPPAYSASPPLPVPAATHGSSGVAAPAYEGGAWSAFDLLQGVDVAGLGWEQGLIHTPASASV